MPSNATTGSKYTREELQAMAREVLAAEKRGDMRALQLQITVGMRTGLHPDQVKARIRALAEGGVDEHA